MSTRQNAQNHPSRPTPKQSEPPDFNHTSLTYRIQYPQLWPSLLLGYPDRNFSRAKRQSGTWANSFVNAKTHMSWSPANTRGLLSTCTCTCVTQSFQSRFVKWKNDLPFICPLFSSLLFNPTHTELLSYFHLSRSWCLQCWYPGLQRVPPLLFFSSWSKGMGRGWWGFLFLFGENEIIQ